MAKLIVSVLSSLDGYCAGPEGQLDGLPMDAPFDTHNLDCLRRADTLLFGATTFRMFESFWPNLDRGPDCEPTLREIAERLSSARKLVASDTIRLDRASPWADTEVVRRSDVRARIAELKAIPGPDVLVYGSPTLFNGLLAEGLVDELHLLLGSVVLGEGVPTFAPGLAWPLTLLGQRRLPGSDTVALHYDCQRR